MSNLDYPISILIAKGKEISTALQLTGNNQMQKTNLLNSIRNAVNILTDKEIKMKMKEKKKEIDGDLENINL